METFFVFAGVAILILMLPIMYRIVAGPTAIDLSTHRKHAAPLHREKSGTRCEALPARQLLPGSQHRPGTATGCCQAQNPCTHQQHRKKIVWVCT